MGARWIEEWMGSEDREDVLTLSSLGRKEARKMVAACGGVAETRDRFS